MNTYYYCEKHGNTDSTFNFEHKQKGIEDHYCLYCIHEWLEQTDWKVEIREKDTEEKERMNDILNFPSSMEKEKYKFLETYSIEPNTLFINETYFDLMCNEKVMGLYPNMMNIKSAHLVIMNLSVYLFKSHRNDPNFFVGLKIERKEKE